MRAVATIIVAAATAQVLSGCIVAAVPVAAGAAIARSESKRKAPVPDVPAAQTALPVKDTPSAASPPSLPPVTTATVVAAMPAPTETGAPRTDAQFAPMLAHVRSRATLWTEGAPIKSLALDERRTVLSPVAIDCQRRPPVVLVDLDPAATGPDPRMIEPAEAAAQAIAPAVGWVDAVAAIRAMDVGLVWISGHPEKARGALANLLRHSGLDPNGRDRILAIGAEGQSKQILRLNIARSSCILAVVGDKRGDADEAYDYLRQPNAILPIDSNWGEGWFLLPPPLIPIPATIKEPTP